MKTRGYLLAIFLMPLLTSCQGQGTQLPPATEW